MVIYGTRAITIRNGEIRNVTCPNCDSETTMHYAFFRKYAHIYWIPLFPVSKIKVVECNHCKKTYQFKELPQPIQQKLIKESERHPINTPVWMFAGVFIIAGLIGWGFYSSSETAKNEAEYVQHPKTGDVYYYKCDTVPRMYSAFRVGKVTKDSIFLTMNDYLTDQQSSVDEIDVAKNYTEAKFSVGKDRIIALQKSDTIFTVIRK